MSFRKYSLEQLFMLFFFIAFSLVLSFIIYNSSVFFDSMDASNKSYENLRIARSYLFISVKSADSKDAISKEVVDDLEILCIKNKEENSVKYVFFDEGYLWECYTDEGFDKTLSEKIVALSGFGFTIDSELITYKLEFGDIDFSGNLVLRAEL